MVYDRVRGTCVHETQQDKEKCEFCLTMHQPERSKREDLDIDNVFTNEDFSESRMRCSEQYRNILREVQ